MRLKNSQGKITILVKRNILLGLLLIISMVTKSQQDPQFSQNQFNLFTVNPGCAGAAGLINTSLLNRFQWVGFPGAPVTTVFNMDAAVALLGKNDGLGVSIMNDAIGYEKNISFSLNYAWRKEIGSGKLGTGISLGLMNKNLKPGWTEMEGIDLNNSSDPAIPAEEASGMLLDLGAGLYYQREDFYLSLSARHINQASFSFEPNGTYSIRRHYYFMGGYNIGLSDKLKLLPSVFFKTDGSAYQLDYNITVEYDHRLWGGIGYRPGDAVLLQLGTELRNGIRFGYAYDLSTSSLSKYNSGSHEIYLSYSFSLDKRKTHKYKSVRYL